MNSVCSFFSAAGSELYAMKSLSWWRYNAERRPLRVAICVGIPSAMVAIFSPQIWVAAAGSTAVAGAGSYYWTNRTIRILKAEQLISGQTSWLSKTELVELLIAIPPEERANFIRQVQACISPKMVGGEGCATVQFAKHITKIPANERDDIVRWAQRLFTGRLMEEEADWCDAYVRSEIINCLATVPANERNVLIQQCHMFITDQTDENVTSQIVKFFATVPVNERDVFIRQCHMLFPVEMSQVEKLRIMQCLMECLAAAPVNEREVFIRQCFILITDKRVGWHQFPIMKCLAAVPVNEREVFIRQYQELITAQMDGEERFQIMASLAAVPINERAASIRLCQECITAEMGGFKRSQILKRAVEIRALIRSNQTFGSTSMPSELCEIIAQYAVSI